MFSLRPRSTLISLVVLYLFAFVAATPVSKRTARTSAPDGALVVRGTSAASGEYETIQAAVDDLPDDGTEQVIFVYAGTYNEQVYITRDGMTSIMGETEDTSDYTGNTVTITNSLSATEAGDDDSSGTLRVAKDDFALYNIDVKNTFGQAASGGQAIALSAYGSGAYYGCGFYSYQDTVLTETGNQFFGSCYIEGAVDYIFGQHSMAFFQSCTLASVGVGAITANGAASEGDSLYVLNECNIITSENTSTDLTGKVYLGRPWTEYAQVVYTSCTMDDLINEAGWEVWSSSTPNTGDVVLAEYKSSGDGADDSDRASFATVLSSTSGYDIASVLGSTFVATLDTAYT